VRIAALLNVSGSLPRRPTLAAMRQPATVREGARPGTRPRYVKGLAVHKFKCGDLVQFQTGFLQPRTASGVYTVVRALPPSPEGQLQYQVKSDMEPHGRLALEHQLVRVSEPNQLPAARPPERS
jgi:hypothetical protein